MKKEKLPGGEAQGMENKDFSKKEQKAIEKGSKIELQEHGPLAPKEIAKDHVAELGSDYYDDKKGLPAMEKQLEKANPSMKPADINTSMKVAYDPNMSKEEHVDRVKHHESEAMKAATEGNKASAMWHRVQAHKHHMASIGKAPELPTHVVDSGTTGASLQELGKAEKGVHQPSYGSIRIGEKEGSIKGRSFAGDLVRQGRTDAAKGWHSEKLKELQNMEKPKLTKGDVVSIKTGKEIKATPKMVANQPTGSNSGYPTPSPVTPEGKIGEVSEKVFDKFNNPKPKPNPIEMAGKIEAGLKQPGPMSPESIARIKNSLAKINQLMGELHGKKEEQPKPTHLTVVKSEDSDNNPKPKQNPIDKGGIILKKGKHADAARTGECYNCGEKVGKDKLVVNSSTRWPVCEQCDWDLTTESSDDEFMEKSVQFASGYLSKSIKSDCRDCGCPQQDQWHDSAKKSESCKKCGTPLKKSGLPEEMPNAVRMLSKAENTVLRGEYLSLLKKSVAKLFEEPKKGAEPCPEVMKPSEIKYESVRQIENEIYYQIQSLKSVEELKYSVKDLIEKNEDLEGVENAIENKYAEIQRTIKELLDKKKNFKAPKKENLEKSQELLQKPPVSEAQRRAMGAAASGESTLGIPKKVGKEFIAKDPGGQLPEKTKKALWVGNPEGPAPKPDTGTPEKTSKWSAMLQKAQHLKKQMPSFNPAGVASLKGAFGGGSNPPPPPPPPPPQPTTM